MFIVAIETLEKDARSYALDSVRSTQRLAETRNATARLERSFKPEGAEDDAVVILESLALFFANLPDAEYRQLSEGDGAIRYHAAASRVRIHLPAGKTSVRKAFNTIAIMPRLGYYRSFANQMLISDFLTSAMPVESIYKPWQTLDAEDTLMLHFSNSKRLHHDDNADDMSQLAKTSHAQMPDRLNTTPDHLSLLLETYVRLAAAGPQFEPEAQAFAANHLDWMGEYRERLDELEPHITKGARPGCRFASAAVTAIEFIVTSR